MTTRKTRILDVVYNASNNELVRTKALVKNAIVQVDPTPFKAWYEQHYGVKVGVKKAQKKAAAEEMAEKKVSNHVQRTHAERQKTRTLDPALDEAFASPLPHWLRRLSLVYRSIDRSIPVSRWRSCGL